MILVVGGQAQGKRSYALAVFGLKEEQVADGADCPLDQIPGQPALNHLHLLVRRLLAEKYDPTVFVKSYLTAYPQAVILADEIGGGVVPLDAEERHWREETGRLCCWLAGMADRVDRVCCGLGMTIKGGDA